MNQGDVLNYTYRLIEPIGHGMDMLFSEGSSDHQHHHHHP